MPVRDAHDRASLVFARFNWFRERQWRSHFFFQAEDGIRDRSPSRGLGDVYKRQAREDHLEAHGLLQGTHGRASKAEAAHDRAS